MFRSIHFTLLVTTYFSVLFFLKEFLQSNDDHRLIIDHLIWTQHGAHTLKPNLHMIFWSRLTDHFILSWTQYGKKIFYITVVFDQIHN